MPRVDFYVSAEAGEGARLRLACRVAEKAYLAKQKVVVFSDDASLLPKIDELLWTFGDGSFVPHDTVTRDGAACEAPVALTSGPLPEGTADVLVNLGAAVPPFFEKFGRIAEFLDARPEVRAAGRERFKTYRAKSIEPTTHNV
ncbi:MAG TPA: DNA polymerase III subunit chi [Steroidobacteraceae bacterium]|nr:DNA polymerase III subunit chi [Steroidobacteraceae bacterium]